MTSMYRVRFSPTDRKPNELRRELRALAGEYPYIATEETGSELVVLIAGQHLAGFLDRLAPVDAVVEPVGSRSGASESSPTSD